MAYSGSYNDLKDKPTTPDVTVNDSGSGTYVTDVMASGHTITLTRGTPSYDTSISSSNATSTNAPQTQAVVNYVKERVNTNNADMMSVVPTVNNFVYTD